jgi:hypothetical protein
MTDALTCLHVVIFKVLKRQECESRLKRGLLVVGVTICEQALVSWLTEIMGGNGKTTGQKWDTCDKTHVRAYF